MKLLTDWGFTREGWRDNQHGEYLVVLQGVLVIGFILLPVYRPIDWSLHSLTGLYILWSFAGVLGLGASILFLKGFSDLGNNLTPLPYPREDGCLVQSGVYRVVRHPIYSGLILAALSWSLLQMSVSHLVGTAILFAFFDFKANREEAWLTQKYPDYSHYQQQVKKLLPGLY
jgi:protein-S-isoprenylcysteine O-methyltransferase Ste14